MTQEKSEIYLKAFVELNEIINHLNTNLKNKIPKKTLEAIKNSGDKNYQFKYDNTQSLSKQKLLPETISLLSIITLPLVAVSIPPKIFNIVVLPAPDGPKTTVS